MSFMSVLYVSCLYCRTEDEIQEEIEESQSLSGDDDDGDDDGDDSDGVPGMADLPPLEVGVLWDLGHSKCID